MKATKIEKKVQLDEVKIVKLQILTYCFLNNISVADGELDCLAQLAIAGKSDFNTFCKETVKLGIYGSAQAVRNSIDKSVLKELVIKDDQDGPKNRKSIHINPDLKVTLKVENKPLIFQVIAFVV